jgi:hypothetical protein
MRDVVRSEFTPGIATVLFPCLCKEQKALGTLGTILQCSETYRRAADSGSFHHGSLCYQRAYTIKPKTSVEGTSTDSTFYETARDQVVGYYQLHRGRRGQSIYF